MDLDDAPLAARQVLLDHNVSKYEGGYEPENLGAEQDFAQRMIYENGSSEIVFETGNIPGTDPYHDAGVEAFRLYALPDGEVAQTEIAVAKVQVWPMAEGQIVGLDAETDYDTIPEVRIPLNNLYPKSETWAQIYPGTPSLGTEGKRRWIAGSCGIPQFPARPSWFWTIWTGL